MNRKTALLLLLSLMSAGCLGLEIEGFTPDKSVIYKTVDGVDLKLHLFYPSNSNRSDKMPAIIFFFGGGWNGGSPSQFYPHCKYFASRGMVAMSAEYRVKSVHGTLPPECVKDGKSAIRWIRQHAAQLEIDPNAIVAGGGSAGGHVAAATATLTKFDDPSDDTSVCAIPNALVLFNPVFDNGPTGWGYDRVKEYWRDISPLHNINKNTPPAIIFLGTKDTYVPISTAEAFKTKMGQLGIRCDLLLYKDQRHGFFNYKNPEYFQKTIEKADKFLVSLGFLTACHGPDAHAIPLESELKQRFQASPREEGVRCWWWWLNGNVTQEAITKDLEAMHEKGFSGAMIFDAGGADQRGNAQVPKGPTFGSPEWTELYLHALKEAQRLGLELGLSIQSGWNLGGPNVTDDFAAKKLVWSEIQVQGPASYSQPLPVPSGENNYYRDICVLAYPERRQAGHNASREPIRDLALKSGFKELGGSAPDTRFLLEDQPSVAGEEDVLLGDIQNITARMSSEGTLTWDVPAGIWTVLRFGYAPTNAKVSTSSGDWKGLVIDYLSKEAFDRYWGQVVDPLLKKAGPLAGTVLKQLETDSWECDGMNWSPNFSADFKTYRGYDPISYLPVIAGKIVENRDISNAFLADFRKTLADCVSDNHYKVFAEHAARYKIGIQPESAGPHAGPLDGIKNYSHSDIVMSEFWVPSPHRPTPERRFFVKQAASAAHIYGKRYVGAESFTSIGPHWNDVLWRSQKPSMDHEYCAGLNAVFFHTFTCSPKEMGLPGQEYFAGTHINPQVTWWDYSDAFINYMNRIQSVVCQGQFVADVLYYYGDHVPNIAALKESDPARAMPGYDYDVTNEDVLLQLKVIDGKVIVPSGIGYRLLVLPDHKVLSLAALEKVDELLQQGATILGPKAERLVSLVGGQPAQKKFHELAAKLWGKTPSESGQKNIGKGRLVWGKTARQVLQNDGIAPDFEVKGAAQSSLYDYIHYTIDDAEVYFVSNQNAQPQAMDCTFRISGRQPELWNPVTGQIQSANAFKQSDGRTTVPLQFDPYGSMLVVFGDAISTTQNGSEKTNFPELKWVQEIQGPWQVSFDPAWGGPASIQFDTLTDWTQHSNEGIKFYSGKAAYQKTFTYSEVAPEKRYWLQLNNIEDIGIAAIKLNGKDLGVVWTKPFRVDITEALKAGQNQLDIVVVNSWRNRLVGDRDKPQDERYTKTNIAIRKDWELLKSGLLGPVELKSN